jgi:AraC-like DNA-binding protein
MPVSIRDVARHLNLSITTVSRALNNYEDVSEETRQRVRKAAAELGYIPNRAARQLRHKYSDTTSCRQMPPDYPTHFSLSSSLGWGMKLRTMDMSYWFQLRHRAAR